MLKTIAALVCFGFTIHVLKAESPTERSHREQSSKKRKKEAAAKIAPAQPLTEGWSLVNGIWMHSDGYKYVKGQIIRIGTQTHKTPPKPPTQAEMEAATKKKKAPLTPAEISAAKPAERERNMRPLPSRQTGTNL